VTTALAEYYARRAAEYDAIYERPERQADLQRLGVMVAGLLADRTVLEVACGTGYWTRLIAAHAQSVIATDIGRGVIELAKHRLAGDRRVTFVRADAFRLAGLRGPYPAAFAGFWWSHIARADVSRFLDVLHSRLGAGARVVIIDNLYVEGSSTPIGRRDEAGNTYQCRTLADGSRHEVLKNFPTADEFHRALSGRATKVRFDTLTYYWCGSYEVE
jgi:SAM-dependent methyltransferase